MSTTITENCWARVRLLPGCPGDGRRPHHPAENTVRVFVTTVDNDGDHPVFGLYKGGSQNNIARPEGGLGIGRYFRPDELVLIPEPP